MVWILNGLNFELDLKSGSPTKGHHFVKNHLKSRPKRPDLEWSGFQMVRTIAIAIAQAQSI